MGAVEQEEWCCRLNVVSSVSLLSQSVGVVSGRRCGRRLPWRGASQPTDTPDSPRYSACGQPAGLSITIRCEMPFLRALESRHESA